MFWPFARRATRQAQAQLPTKIYVPKFKAKRLWPPDFSKLSEKHQFRLERRYRRRAKLKFARPAWVKGTKAVQWSLILFVVVYGVLFEDWNNNDGLEHQHVPFERIRSWFFGLGDAIWPEDKMRKHIDQVDDTSLTASTAK